MVIITEQINSKTINIDVQNGKEIARLINNEDQKVALAIAEILPQIGLAIEKIAERLQKGGRMAYFGAGTSGRIGILDASEMTPTFGVSSDLVRGYIAGGDNAIRYEAFGAEDLEELAADDIADFAPSENDVVVGVSAGGGPRYVLKALELARQYGALTIGITSNPEAKLKPLSDIFLNPLLGPEAITGSSRMKSGTAQKMILNMLSTGAMIRIGKTYKNYMIDFQPTNEKLQARAVRFIMEITGADEQSAIKTMAEAKSVKTACVMLVKNVSKQEAENLLQQNEGILRKVI